jgi:hypothetical protein
MTLYRIEFGPAWPVPPITVDFTDHDTATRTVVAHAVPHLRPVLAEQGRPELADCLFQTNEDQTAGQFLWLDLAGGRGARFCPARLTPVDAEETHVVADDSDDPEHIDDCPGCEAFTLTGHRAAPSQPAV